MYNLYNLTTWHGFRPSHRVLVERLFDIRNWRLCERVRLRYQAKQADLTGGFRDLPFSPDDAIMFIIRLCQMH